MIASAKMLMAPEWPLNHRPSLATISGVKGRRRGGGGEKRKKGRKGKKRKLA